MTCQGPLFLGIPLCCDRTPASCLLGLVGSVGEILVLAFALMAIWLMLRKGL